MMTMDFERVLVATDFSPVSRPALGLAEGLAAERGARLLVLHAYQVPQLVESAGLTSGVHEDLERAVRADAERRLEDVVAGARSRGVDARGLLREGLPDEEILDAAAREGVDLVVVGTHGRRGASRLFMGSVAAKVVSRSPCPVMTVRAAPPAPAKRSPRGGTRVP